ncbi:DUF3139 domain-containing protein [Terribacillus saccharophilus]|uniref:DUF3139 domain-containing protein n=1 Tax=Terribacillus saccharophilus TaxID=361277 RepID=UPI002989D69E|nr:DUF3139 domain-containing protein [Terribacillus saccharophilus]MCM3224235.1 DUF3139 domain-containing protein [Terribacillus saccharophilus]
MKKILVIVIVLLALISITLLSLHFYNRHQAEEKIDSYIKDYGLTKQDIETEEYPLFNSLSAPKGYFKSIFTSEDKDNYYIFHYDKDTDKVTFSGVVEGNEVSIDDELIKKLKHQPSEKVLQ